MNNKDLSKIIGAFLSFCFLFLLFSFTSVKSVHAASAYILPASGYITQPEFKVSVYVETVDGEPSIASTDLIITHSANARVVSMGNADFDNYLQKTFDETTNEINISAMNNATSPKSGKVKVVTITFAPQTQTGEVHLTISSDSKVTGSGNEQLLAETINSVYNLEVSDVKPVDPVIPDDPVIPETGTSDVVMYALLSLALFSVGFLFWYKPNFNKNRR